MPGVGFQPSKRSGVQWYGSCPLDASTSGHRRSFSVNVALGCYYRHGRRSDGNQLEFWAAATKLPLHQAAIDLCDRHGRDVPWIRRWGWHPDSSCESHHARHRPQTERNTVATALALTQDDGRTLSPHRRRGHRYSENSRPIGELPSIIVIRTASITLTLRLVASSRICNAHSAGGLSTLPDVPPSVCYPSGRRRQRRGPKPGGQRNLDPWIGRGRASRHGDCQHQGGRGPAVRGTVNPGEVPLKAVMFDRPKMLTGLNQKGTWPGTGASAFLCRG